MGLNQKWFNDVVDALNESGIICEVLAHPFFYLLNIREGNLVLNLVPFINDFNPGHFVEQQMQFVKTGKQLVHLWEDVWVSRKVQVLNRIESLLGLNKRIHGRKTKANLLSKQEADLFFNKYHVNGSVNAKYWFSLVYEFEVVAVASFSQVRPMKHKGKDYRSVELVRFASKPGLTVTGGLTKLIKYFSEIADFNDLMSYADRDWSLGKGYDSSGFQLEGLTEPSKILLDTKTLTRYFPHRLPTNLSDKNDLIYIFNTGNLKYILYL